MIASNAGGTFKTQKFSGLIKFILFLLNCLSCLNKQNLSCKYKDYMWTRVNFLGITIIRIIRKSYVSFFPYHQLFLIGQYEGKL